MMKKTNLAKIIVKFAALALSASVMFSCNVYAKDKKEGKKETQKTVNETKNANKNTTSNTSDSTNPKSFTKGVYHVAQDGTGDFNSIATAVVLVPSGSTLIIHEGIYNEAITIQSKQINMRGVSKDKCVIQFDTQNYAKVPLNIVSGLYENLTIKGYHKAKQQGAFPGYAIHIDCDTLAGQAVTFSNCNIISENAFCVGIGLRKGARITFRGCNFVASKQGAILFHDSQTPALAGNASLSLEGCVINNKAEGLIVTQCLSPASTTNITFKNNTVVGNGDGFCLAYGSYAGSGTGWMGSNNVILTKNSAGNNIMSFNYADMAKYNAMMAEKSALLAAQNAGQVGPNGKKKINKFYTIIDEEGREVNVPAENIDGVITYEDGTYEIINVERNY